MRRGGSSGWWWEWMRDGRRRCDGAGGEERTTYSISSSSRARPPFLALADSLRGWPLSSYSETSVRRRVTAVGGAVVEEGCGRA